jgi:hypothetical protein
MSLKYRFYSANKFASTGADKSANTFSNSQKGLKNEKNSHRNIYARRRSH